MEEPRQRDTSGGRGNRPKPSKPVVTDRGELRFLSVRSEDTPVSNARMGSRGMESGAQGRRANSQRTVASGEFQGEERSSSSLAGERITSTVGWSYGEEEWIARAQAAEANGEQVLAAELCPDCSYVVSLDGAKDRAYAGVVYCKCGTKRQEKNVYALHGIPRKWPDAKGRKAD